MRLQGFIVVLYLVLFGNLNALDSQYIELLNYLNDARKKQGLGTLCYDQRLITTAQMHTQEMVQMQRMTHSTLDGSTMGDRAGYLGMKWSILGENVGMGMTTAEDIFSAWMNSPGHRANMLSPNYNSCGSFSIKTYWTMEFAHLHDLRCINGPTSAPTNLLPFPKRNSRLRFWIRHNNFMPNELANGTFNGPNNWRNENNDEDFDDDF